MRRLAEVDYDDVSVAVSASVQAIHLQLRAIHDQVKAAAVAKAQLLELIAKVPGKFSVSKMASGTIDDFHKGLMDRIG